MTRMLVSNRIDKKFAVQWLNQTFCLNNCEELRKRILPLATKHYSPPQDNIIINSIFFALYYYAARINSRSVRLK